MAQLHVQHKHKTRWWLWILLAIIAIVVLFFLMGDDTAQDNTRSQNRQGVKINLILTTPTVGNSIKPNI
jgi:hypothetical protein